MNNTLEDFMSMVEETFNPDKGKGNTETILAVMIVCVWLTLMFLPQTSTALDVAVSLILGFYFGQKTGVYGSKRCF